MLTRIVSAAVVAAVFAAPASAGAILFDPPPQPVVAAPQPIMPAPRALPDWSGPYVGVQAGWGRVEIRNGGTDRDSGFIYGGHLGFDQQLGNLVVGAEAQYDRLNMEPFPGVRARHTVRLLAKGGYAFGNTLAYVKAGGANISARVFGDSSRDWAWVAGLGAEHLVTPNISVGAEFLHHRKNDFDGLGVDARANTFNVRASYRF